MRRIVFTLAAALILSAKASAAFLGFSAASNLTLKNRMLSEVKAACSLMIGEPQYFMLQEFMLQVEAAADPYAWLDQTHEFCHILENIYGPVPYHPGTQYRDRMQQLRRSLLQIADYPYHEVSLNNKQATGDGDTIFYSPEQSRIFYEATYEANRQRRADISEALKVKLEEDECQLIKVYSSGYIFRTRSHCVAADLCYRRCYNTSEGMDELVDAIDILFTSHPHDDHYDELLWRKLSETGKPMLFAYDIDPGTKGNKICWMEGDDRRWAVNYTPGKVERAVIPLPGGGQADVTAVHSRQGPVPLLMYLAKADGWSFLHIADSSEKQTWKSFENKEFEVPDFVFSPQDTPVVLKTLSRMGNPSGKPYFYFTTHENEYEHSVCRRASYSWLLTASHCLGNAGLFDFSGCCVLIDNGESLIFKKGSIPE
ncbi:MAG: hypothetical protein MJY62_04410 [Bacteroidales bacterium]|nr:hypothetical protein [Bacteroidales bacterium]